ncbi:7-carboxy-7-deazaguanine synthase QueE [Persicobacter diffluens]|uniref:7-carboxy-7-deazaguanine synthase n=1 Tax=Persicobacter diffluens TaxID=981 RepID=A0AAN4VYF2_9BACT|nr:7-carboxy-7-deazaguanine synthase [Persicobacter diffluens]
MNKGQAVYTTAIAAGEELPIMEAFYTLQGEGKYAGHAAYFIRLAGCDVGCVWCDVKESWDAALHPVQTVKQIVDNAAQHQGRLAVVTGGEPLMYNCDLLTDKLQAAGFRTNIETSGAHPLSGQWDWITLSPKKFKKPLAEVCEAADELKVVIFHKSDFKWAEEYAAMVKPDCKLLLQVEWGKSAELLPQIIEYVKEHPEWQVSLQTHKYMDIP